MIENMELKKEDLKQLEAKGIQPETVRRQLQCLQDTAHFVECVRPAVDGDGIITLTDKEMDRYDTQYGQQINGIEVVKFVPASGAATRMFKKWFQLLENGTEEDLSCEAEQLPEYPFYPVLAHEMEKKGLSLADLLQKKEYHTVFSFILKEDGLNYGQMPKGLLPFHRYGDGIRSAFEEHWMEGAVYACGGGKVRLHFTVSPEHLSNFQALSDQLKSKYERDGLLYEVSFSEQMPQTDTVSLTEKGDLLRDGQGKLLFRPGGHGSLIYNLNQMDADVVFIKNIDNVTTDALKPDTYRYKKSLLGLLLELQRQCFQYMHLLDNETLSFEEETELKQFMQNKLHCMFPENLAGQTLAGRIACYRRLLDRPIRVCGMVKRENEPGGGPFWTRNGQKVSLQIVETAEMNLDNPEQGQCLEESQYFNPVDLVCSLKNYRQEKYNLLDYVDKERYFIAEKSYKGQKIRVLEHPGLWNGAMSAWHTLFVKVPLSTFTPVKEVRDLLRPAHLNRG